MKLTDLISEVDLERIVKESIETARPNTIKEAYVSEPKTYPQVTELSSQKTKDAHSKLYGAYVDSLNRVSAELDTVSRNVDDVNSSHSDFRSLKLDETYNLNAKWLHELFFSNCFDPQSEVYMDSLAYIRLQRDFGDFESWQKDLIACAMSCGSGWAVTAYNMHLQRFVNTVISNHSQDVMVGLYPVICIDMHEHSYFRDYIGDKKSYLLNMMRELNWTVIEERVAKADAIAKVLK